MQAQTPDLIGGRYELLNRLGAGGMGEVFRSRDRLTEEIVALKRALRLAEAARLSPAALATANVPGPRSVFAPLVLRSMTLSPG